MGEIPANEPARGPRPFSSFLPPGRPPFRLLAPGLPLFRPALPMTSLAIIGTGIAGLGCAHFLHRRFDLTVFEQNDYPGGHTNTVEAVEAGRAVPIDTGFMVFNHVTYPLLTRLFRELDVATKPTNMSFSVQHVPTGLEYQRRQPRPAVCPAPQPPPPALLADADGRSTASTARRCRPSMRCNTARLSLREYVAARGYGDDMLHLFCCRWAARSGARRPTRCSNFPP
jgi:predicted NAD/FAD-binding protein